MFIRGLLLCNVHVSPVPDCNPAIDVPDVATVPAQVSKLQRLVSENIDISAADIAAWQNAR